MIKEKTGFDVSGNYDKLVNLDVSKLESIDKSDSF